MGRASWPASGLRVPPGEELTRRGGTFTLDGLGKDTGAELELVPIWYLYVFELIRHSKGVDWEEFADAF